MDKATKQYHKKIADYEEHLKGFIQEQYSLRINFLTVMNWGYTTTAYYLETDKGDFVCRISNFSKNKELGLIKDIEVSNILKNSLNIPVYSKANNGRFLLNYVDLMGKNQLLRISDHTQGVIGFNISEENVGEMGQFLHKLHYGLTIEHKDMLQSLFSKPEGTFLHGDLTPTNCLISYGKIGRVVDFEHSFFGAVEYDLARTAVFAWFHLYHLKFTEIEEILLREYNAVTAVDKKAFNHFAQLNIENHITNIQIHKNEYENEQKFEEELNFAAKMLDSLLISGH
jgi:hypothetical protein